MYYNSLFTLRPFHMVQDVTHMNLYLWRNLAITCSPIMLCRMAATLGDQQDPPAQDYRCYKDTSNCLAQTQAWDGPFLGSQPYIYIYDFSPHPPSRVIALH